MDIMMGPDKVARGPEEFVKCPKCEMIQKAKKLTHVLHTHPCEGCKHPITNDEWVTIHTKYTDGVICPHCGCEGGSDEADQPPARRVS